MVDKDGKRCPLDNRTIQFDLKGNAEWRGGIAQGKDNYILNTSLPVECGINRALIRSTTQAGKITLTAKAEGLPSATITLATLPVVSAKAGANNETVNQSFDDNERSEWMNDGKLSTAWITYTLEKEAAIDDICIKLNGWRSRSYPLEVFAGNTMIWSGDTNKSLGYVHLNVEKPVRSKQITIRLKGNTSDQDAFGQITEVAAKAANDMELEAKANKNNANLRIIEIEFLEAIK